jgi:hypothetical protein
LLETSNWNYFFQVNAQNQIQSLFMASPVSIELARKYNLVLLMDCTYNKTNRFEMPLMEVVGKTPSNKTFFVAFVFLAEEIGLHWKLV